MPLHRHQAELCCGMRSAAARHSWMHHQSQTSLRCGVIEPLGYEEKPFANRKGPPLRACVCDPVVVLLFLNDGFELTELPGNRLPFALWPEKRAQALRYLLP